MIKTGPPYMNSEGEDVSHREDGLVWEKEGLMELRREKRGEMSRLLAKWFNNVAPEVYFGRRCTNLNLV